MYNPYVEINWPSGVEKYSQRAIQFTGSQSKPYLLKVPQITRALNIDHTIENTTLILQLSDYTGYFTEKEKTDKYIFGRKVKMYHNNTCLFTGWIAEPPKSEDKIYTLKADLYSILKSPINLVITRDDYPNITPGTENANTYGNIILGASIQGWYTAKRIDTNTYHAAWNPLTEITKAKTKDGQEINLTDINLTIQDEISYIEYISTEETIHFAGKGPQENGELIENPIRMLQYILENFTTLEVEDLSEIIELYENRDYPGNHLFITDGITISEFFSYFSESYGGRPLITREGKVNVKTLRWGDQTPVNTLREQEIKNFRKWKEYKYLRHAWGRNYNYDPSTGQYNYNPIDIESTSLWSNQNGTINQRYLLLDPDSRDIALREKFLKEAPLLFYSFQVPGKYMNSIDYGDIIELTHRKGFSTEPRLMQILRLSTVENSGFIAIEGFDITEIQKKGFLVYPAGDPRNPWVYEENNQENPWAWFKY